VRLVFGGAMMSIRRYGRVHILYGIRLDNIVHQLLAASAHIKNQWSI
jgi:hypothetical protein